MNQRYFFCVYLCAAQHAIYECWFNSDDFDSWNALDTCKEPRVYTYDILFQIALSRIHVFLRVHLTRSKFTGTSTIKAAAFDVTNASKYSPSPSLQRVDRNQMHIIFRWFTKSGVNKLKLSPIINVLRASRPFISFFLRQVPWSSCVMIYLYLIAEMKWSLSP